MKYHCAPILLSEQNDGASQLQVYKRRYRKSTSSWQLDPLTCSKCAGEMRVISFICQHQVIRKIPQYLKICEEKKQHTPPLKKTPVKEMELVSFGDG